MVNELSSEAVAPCLEETRLGAGLGEQVEIGKALEGELAKRHGGDRSQQQAGKFSGLVEAPKGDTRDLATNAVGCGSFSPESSQADVLHTADQRVRNPYALLGSGLLLIFERKLPQLGELRQAVRSDLAYRGLMESGLPIKDLSSAISRARIVSSDILKEVSELGHFFTSTLSHRLLKRLRHLLSIPTDGTSRHSNHVGEFWFCLIFWTQHPVHPRYIGGKHVTNQRNRHEVLIVHCFQASNKILNLRMRYSSRGRRIAQLQPRCHLRAQRTVVFGRRSHKPLLEFSRQAEVGLYVFRGHFNIIQAKCLRATKRSATFRPKQSAT